jgi:DDE domain
MKFPRAILANVIMPPRPIGLGEAPSSLAIAGNCPRTRSACWRPCNTSISRACRSVTSAATIDDDQNQLRRGYRFPPVIIQQAIWLYVRFTLSFRDVEDLLAERGIVVSYETVRRWVSHFGPRIAADLHKRRPKPRTTWHLDEVYLKIDGRLVYPWRAVDSEGEVLERTEPSGHQPCSSGTKSSRRDCSCGFRRSRIQFSIT